MTTKGMCRRLKAALIVFAIAMAHSSVTTGQQRRPGDLRVAGPYNHKNLSIFLIQGPDRWKGRTPLTLQQALGQKKVVVHETGTVQKLAIENLSPEEEVYVQFGDIVKGGNQDRVLVTDLVLPPHGGKVSIAAFCVEPGRWSRRGKEAAGWFSSSEQQLPSKDLKVAAGVKADQQEVWKAVGATRERLSRAAAVPGGAAGAGSGTFVAAPPPAMPASSSLALMVEAKEVRKSAEDYTKALGTTVNDKPDVVGYAFAVNGKLVGAEVYSSQSLFRGMWAKLLKAAALEAMADDEKDAKVEPVSSEAVKRFLDAAESKPSSDRAVTDRLKVLKKETDQTIVFESWDRKQAGGWVHRSYVAK